MVALLILAGLVLLIAGGEGLVRGAASLALRLHIPPMIVGLTVVSFGTSAPELMVSLQAALKGHPDMAVGNVVGSNLSNIGLILGLTALFFRIEVDRKDFRRDFLFLLLFTGLYYGLLLDGETNFFDGLLLLLVLGAYLFLLLRSVRIHRVKAREEEVEVQVPDPLWRSLLFIILGLIGLKYGADLLVNGSVTLAEIWGVSERVISLSIVSVGTSLPELAASIISAFRGQKEMALGNVIGSNIFNIGSVIGICSLITPVAPESDQILTTDYWWMIAMTLAIPVLMWFPRQFQFVHWKGGLLLAGYLTYLWVIFG